MPKVDIDESLVGELKRLKDRFEDLSRHHPPVSLCVVKVCKPIEDHRRHESGLFCVPPPEPWLSLVEAGAWQSLEDMIWNWDAYIIRTLIRRADDEAWRRLTPVAAHASRTLQLVPPEAWPGGRMWNSLSMYTQDGWRWFNTVFDLALAPPHPKLLSVDNSDQGGFFWWEDSRSPIVYTSGDSRIMEEIKQTGRYGAVISDVALQSALAISCFLDLVYAAPAAGEEPENSVRPLDPSGERPFSKEEKALWWYRWVQALEPEREISEEEAYTLLQNLATTKESHVHPPWSPNRTEWPSTRMSLETFQKYLARCRLKKQLRARHVEGSSVVRQLARDGVISSDARVVPATEPNPRHPQAKSLRAAAADQEARDAAAAELGYELEPPIDSQGFPI